MFDIAHDFDREKPDFKIVSGYLSPVDDEYEKPGLVSAHHRLARAPLSEIHILEPFRLDRAIVF